MSSKETVCYSFTMQATIIYLLLSAVVISADIQFLQSQPELKANKDQTEPTSAELQAFLETNDVKNLIVFFERRDIDVKHVIAHLANNPERYGLGHFESSESRYSQIMKILSSPKDLAMIKKKMEENPGLGGFVAAIEDPEFKTLLYRAINSKAPLDCVGCGKMEARGFFKKVWKAALKKGISVSIPFPG